MINSIIFTIFLLDLQTGLFIWKKHDLLFSFNYDGLLI